jgi:multiple sugar transport system permease protein
MTPPQTLLATAERPVARRRRRRRSSRASWSRVLVVLALMIGAAGMVFPFVWTVVTSFTTGQNVLSTPHLIPQHPGLDGYRQLFDTLPFWRNMANSLGLAVASTALQLITSAMAAYTFARFEFRGKNAIFVCYLATLMIPMQVLVVPLFVEMRELNLVDTYAGLLAPTIASAFGVFLLRQAIMVVPRELDEAAVIDGAGHIRIFCSIILPLIRPALATFGLFAFMSSWNSFLWPLVITRSPEFMTLPLSLSTLSGQFTTQWNVVMAGSVLSIVPIILLYLVAQRHIVQSVALSGLK